MNTNTEQSELPLKPAATGDASEPFAVYRRMKHFASLDGLRCLSIVWVIGFHCQLTGFGHELFRTGQYGVSLFFVISGFLITTLLLREQRANGEISLKAFYLRRTLRIFPLYYAALALYTVLVILLEKGPERGAFFHNLPFYLTYTNNWFVDKDASERVIFAFAWSLATEEQFYLAWPWIVRFSKRWNVPLFAIGGALVLDLCAEGAAALGWLGDEHSQTVRILTSIASPICAGCILAYAFDRPESFRFAWRVLGSKLSAPLALVAVAVTYALQIEPVMIAAMVLLVGACCIRNDNGLAWPLSNPPVRYVGMISYGLYLLHMLAMNATKKLRSEHDWPFLAIAFAISIALASASYWLYELPFLRLKNRWRRPGTPREKDFATPADSAGSKVEIAPAAQPA
jgi:peptidoglycan/LPS O-acetylase OafA/YrhL